MSIFTTLLSVAGKGNPIGIATSIFKFGSGIVKNRLQVTKNRASATEAGYLEGLRANKQPKTLIQGCLDIALFTIGFWPLALWPLGFFFNKPEWTTLSENFVVHIAALPSQYWFFLITIIGAVWAGRVAMNVIKGKK